MVVVVLLLEEEDEEEEEEVNCMWKDTHRADFDGMCMFLHLRVCVRV